MQRIEELLAPAAVARGNSRRSSPPFLLGHRLKKHPCPECHGTCSRAASHKPKDQRRGAVFDTFYRERRVAAAIDATPIARKEKYIYAARLVVGGRQPSIYPRSCRERQGEQPYRETCTGTGGSNWLRTIIPELVDDGVVPPKVVAGSVGGLGAVVTFEPSGMVDGGFAVVGGDAGLVVVWFEQAAQTPINIAIVAFFIGTSL